MEPLNARRVLKSVEENKLFLKKFGVKRIGLFGSFLKGNARKSSDLDFLVEFNEVSFDNYMDLKFFLERLFKKKVDLVLENSLKPSLKHVLGEAKYVKAI